MRTTSSVVIPEAPDCHRKPGWCRGQWIGIYSITTIWECSIRFPVVTVWTTIIPVMSYLAPCVLEIPVKR